MRDTRFDIWVTFWGGSGRFCYPNVESGEHDATEWTPRGGLWVETVTDRTRFRVLGRFLIKVTIARNHTTVTIVAMTPI